MRASRSSIRVTYGNPGTKKETDRAVSAARAAQGAGALGGGVGARDVLGLQADGAPELALVGGLRGAQEALQRVLVRLQLAPALFQPHGKVRARPGPSGEALCMAAPCKRHVVNDATQSLRV